MIITVRVPSLRTVTLIAVGVMIGAALVAPALAAEPTGGQIRTASCAGKSFYPDASFQAYASEATLRYAPEGGAVLSCDPHLPTGAVVTRVRFTIRDSSNAGRIIDCALVGSGLTLATAEAVRTLADFPPTTGAPGIQRLTDTSINFATIDNGKWGYRLLCAIEPPSNGQWRVGIYGADVTYTIDSPNG